MKEKAAEFAFFSFPCYWTLALACIALLAWKTPLMNPDLLAVLLVSAAIIATAVLLIKKHWWTVLPMIVLGAYITQIKDGFTDHIFQLFGLYMILHYIVCGIYVFKYRRDREE